MPDNGNNGDRRQQRIATYFLGGIGVMLTGSVLIVIASGADIPRGLGAILGMVVGYLAGLITPRSK